MSVTAIVLAGGRGSRMNYQEKAWVAHHEKPLIMHVIDRIKPQVTNLLVSRNRLDPRYDELPYECIADSNENFDGPLAGIAACAAKVETELTLIVPCDTPDLPENLVDELKVHLKDAEVCIAKDNDRDQPLIMLAKTQCLSTIADYLKDGGRSVHGWLQSRGLSRAYFPADQLNNINEVGQLE